jgi:FMN phosphatase YigB (HAD superfamily)
MSARPQAILIDAANTIFTTTCSRPERFSRFLSREGYTVDRGQLQEVMAEADREFDWPDIPDVRSLVEEEAVWASYCRRILSGLGAWICPDLVARAIRNCNYLDFVVLYPDTVPALDYWRGRVRLGLISNSVPSFRQALVNLDVLRYFDDVILSSETGLRKPDPAIYHRSLSNLQIPADQAWFVDDLPENVRAANSIGIRGCWLCRNSSPSEATDLVTIRSLADLALSDVRDKV